ncbi:MAG: zinc-ribbon domain-containing protein [Ruminococcaceae bacterium]|nr:zinc-ribbon domain-containing protein [Oscillospiraceae bacterium]
MALIKCTECGKEISDKAVACPHCGCPTAEMNVRQSEATVGGTADTSIANKSTTENNGSHKPKTTKKVINKKIMIPVLALGCAIIIFAILVFTHTICLKHSYSEATVLRPQTCYHCGKTKGDPKDLMKIEFPTRGVGALLPVPESNMGEINWNEASGFNAYIGNTTEGDYKDYIKACIECGFDVDYQKGDDYYYADDINSNNLNVWFKGNNFMEIQIIAPNLEETDRNDIISKL